ncbi:MAG: toprim domain-containing protein [Candidatus Thiodiazotropha sp. (ex Dulcina madagascariensis)]|nr:toprim domain-containing protein [Candidatus Thiodiazotropha sp. (ex Dulcina madagascariensis)]
MARLPDETVTRIKQEVSLVRLAEAGGFDLKPHGKHYAIHCPFHADDKTPSLIITPDKNLFHCPACGAKGSPIDWVMKIEGVSTRHALELLANDLPHLAAESSPPPKVVKRSNRQKLPSVLSGSADHQTALRQVIDYYHETLKASPEGLDYLEKRGLKNAELIDTFKLGYANRTLAYRLPPSKRQAGAEIRGRLKEIGLLRESTGHEHFNGCLVAPVMDEHGIITEVYGRKILGKRLRKDCAQHLYLPGPHEGVWNAQAVKQSREIILCESLIDAMTFWTHGFRHVTTSYGTAGFTDELLALLVDSSVEKVLIAYDRDEAGNAAADKLAEKLNDNGMDAYRVLFPKGMDANEYALQVTPAPKSLDLALRKAEWMGNGRNKPQSSASRVENNRNDEAAKSENTLQDLPSLVAESPVENTAALAAEISDHEIHIPLGKRHYRIRGLSKNLSYEQLKINLLIQQGEVYHVDTFDLYSAKARAVYIKQAATELGIPASEIKADLGKVLLKLEALQDQQIKGTLAKQEKQPAMSDEEVKEALALLKAPALLDRILQDFTHCGVVGEETNKLVGYLAGVSRKMNKPLAILIQSTSAAGKTSLMDAVLNLMPEEERIQYSAMTGQSLYYMGEKDLKHKILAIAEEEGAEQTSYALKLLQSEGQVTIASTGKNAITGNLETQEYKVEGPVALFYTTTAIDIDEELKNRCITLSVDESREQTVAIHEQQRYQQTLEGILAGEARQDIIRLHHNAQRLLRPLIVSNPYATEMTFLNDKTRTRRDHMKYLSLINVIALLHQYQREVKHAKNHKDETLEYIEVALSDIEAANKLANEVLGRTLDELTPQTRRMLEQLHQYVGQQCQAEQIEWQAVRFTRKAIRDAYGWNPTQCRIHLDRLVDLEYVLAHRGKRGQSYEYELLYQGGGEDAQPFLMGLIDTAKLRRNSPKPEKNGTTAQSWRGEQGRLAGSWRGQNGHMAGGWQSEENAGEPINNRVNGDHDKKPAKNATREKHNGASYRTTAWTQEVEQRREQLPSNPSPALAAHSCQNRSVEI